MYGRRALHGCRRSHHHEVHRPPPHVEVGDTILIRHLRSSPEEATAMASHLQTIGFIVDAALLSGAVAGGVLLVRFLRRHPIGRVFDKPG